MTDPMRKRCLDELARNRLLADVLGEGYVPSTDASLRERCRMKMSRGVQLRRLRRAGLFAAAAAILLALATRQEHPAPVPPLVLPGVSSGPRFEIMTTEQMRAQGRGIAIDVVTTADILPPMGIIGDDELLAVSPRVVGIMGPPGRPNTHLVLDTAP